MSAEAVADFTSAESLTNLDGVTRARFGGDSSDSAPTSRLAWRKRYQVCGPGLHSSV